MQKKLYFWWSASDLAEVTFVRWQRMKMHTGGKDSNKLGVGAVVWSDWRFEPPLCNSKQRSGLPTKHFLVRPYETLYLDNPRYISTPRKLKRPTLKEYERLLKRRTK